MIDPINPSANGWLPSKVGPAPVLALRPRDAARALGISERHLHTMMQRGEIPFARLSDHVVVFSVATLQQWLSERMEVRP